MDISKHRYFISRTGLIVKIISERLDPFDLYVAYTIPKDIYFVNGTDGRSKERTSDDLIKDITCPQCNGKGVFISIVEKDMACKRDCVRCQKKGYIK